MVIFGSWTRSPQLIIPPLSSGFLQEADRWMDFLQTRDFPCGGGTGERWVIPGKFEDDSLEGRLKDSHMSKLHHIFS